MAFERMKFGKPGGFGDSINVQSPQITLLQRHNPSLHHNKVLSEEHRLIEDSQMELLKI